MSLTKAAIVEKFSPDNVVFVFSPEQKVVHKFRGIDSPKYAGTKRVPDEDVDRVKWMVRDGEDYILMGLWAHLSDAPLVPYHLILTK
jgi:hypothetical protein